MASGDVHEGRPFLGKLEEGFDNVLAVMSERIRSEAVDTVFSATAVAGLKSAYGVNGLEIQYGFEIRAMFTTNGDEKLAPLACGKGYAETVGRDVSEIAGQLIGGIGFVKVGEEIEMEDFLDGTVVREDDGRKHLGEGEGTDKGVKEHITGESVNAVRNELVTTGKGTGLGVLTKDDPIVMHSVKPAKLGGCVAVLDTQEF